MSGQRRSGNLYGFCSQVRDVLEESFPLAKKDGDDVEHQFVETAGAQRLLDCACTAGHIDRLIASRLGGSGQRTIETVDEVEDGPAVHLNRFVSVMSKYEHRGVIRGLRTPPAAPIRLAPLA